MRALVIALISIIIIATQGIHVFVSLILLGIALLFGGFLAIGVLRIVGYMLLGFAGFFMAILMFFVFLYMVIS